MNSRIILAVGLLASCSSFAEQPYSPEVNRSYPDNVYWGDTHLHTWLSGDAYSLGTRVTPDEAYRFAKGEAIQSTSGEAVRLRRPLDFLMVADHAENLGVLPRLVAGDPLALKTEDGRRFAAILKAVPALRDIVHADTREAYDAGSAQLGEAKGAWGGDYGIDDDFKREVWHSVVDIAEKYNDPGRFTTFAGYEYSSTGPMLHRNVLFAGSPSQTKQTLPFSRLDSTNPEDLWTHLQDYKDRVNSDVLVIPHNSNLSGGNMFRPANYQGKPLTAADASLRAAMEPIVEVTQIKGDSETHPAISPDDEFADYETWGKFDAAADSVAKGDAKPAAAKPAAKADAAEKPGKSGAKSGAKEASARNVAHAGNTTQADLAKQSYVRSGLQLGLLEQARIGVNPFKLGMIGSTDSHTGLSTADENNFWGKMGANEPGPYRASALPTFTSSGYAAVWAEENTRASIFAAMKRREVYATTGPRILLRFFGGWDFKATDAVSPDLAGIGYRQGVPMGGDLTRVTATGVPAFLIRAVKDPDGANLDRVQVIKGWLDANGALHERVYDVAWSGNRTPDKNGKLPAIASTVDLASAGYRNSTGTAELATTWTDPQFNADEAAFYYVRVLQIPTPRWTAYDQAFYGTGDAATTPPLSGQERAYSSPIWYTP